MMANMILKVSTNNIGSECETDLEISKEEWDALSEKEQDEIINTYKWNIMDLWVEENTQ
jgi:hypothetical protein